MKKLDHIRKALDETDRTILKALAERQNLVKEVFNYKKSNNKNIRDFEREEALLNRIRLLASEAGIDSYFAEHLFRDIINNSLRYQAHSLVDFQNKEHKEASIRISYQGTDGAYSQMAAIRHFGERYEFVESIGFESFEQAANAVLEGKTDYAILPIENTTAGSINDTYDILGNKNLHIVGEEVLKIVHCLLAIEPVEVDKIRRIISHPQAIAQCTNFLSRLSKCKVESYVDTAISAKKILNDADISQAAIAGAHAADYYGLHVIAHDIANQQENYTRFVVVSKNPVKVDKQIPAKTSLMMITSNEEGALIECLNLLHKYKINMAKLESRPRMNEPWRYAFYLDIHGNMANPDVSKALLELKKKAQELKVLGCYADSQVER